MNTQPSVFAQVMAFLPMHEFRNCVRRYRGDYKIKNFFCLDQFLCLAFAQLTYRESLRDIESCLQTIKSRLYHMGIRGRVSRCNLAHANETRMWRIYADFAQVLIAEARRITKDEDIGLKRKETVYAFVSTTIDLCLSFFPWAHFRKRKGAIKLHTLLDLRGSIPTFIQMTDGETHDVRILDDLPLEGGAFHILNCGYLDFARLYTLHLHRDGAHDRVPVAVKPPQKAIECEVDYWYLVGDGDLDFEVVHWATSPDILIDIMDGCSPFFMPDQSLSRNFRTTSNICFAKKRDISWRSTVIDRRSILTDRLSWDYGQVKKNGMCLRF